MFELELELERKSKTRKPVNRKPKIKPSPTATQPAGPFFSRPSLTPRSLSLPHRPSFSRVAWPALPRAATLAPALFPAPHGPHPRPTSRRPAPAAPPLARRPPLRLAHLPALGPPVSQPGTSRPQSAAQRPAHLSPSRLAPPASASPHSSRAAPHARPPQPLRPGPARHAPRPPDLPVPSASGTPLAPRAPDPTSQRSRDALPAADQPAPPVSGSLFPFPSSPQRNRAPRSPARTPGSLSRCAPPRSPPGLFKRPSRTPPSTPIRRANPSRRLVTARSGAPPRPPPVSPCAASIQHPRRCSGPSNPRFASAADRAPVRGTRTPGAAPHRPLPGPSADLAAGARRRALCAGFLFNPELGEDPPTSTLPFVALA